jgi:hypothetical protein
VMETVAQRKRKSRSDNIRLNSPCAPQASRSPFLGRFPGSQKQLQLHTFRLPRTWAEWHFETLFLRYSGGTAPDSHRTSL